MNNTECWSHEQNSQASTTAASPEWVLENTSPREHSVFVSRSLWNTKYFILLMQIPRDLWYIKDFISLVMERDLFDLI